MGIRGLATFISRYSNKYLEDYKLQNCHLVIDGNSLACLLYEGSAKVNSAFGGDYDRYANSIFEFFYNLQKCKISPVVIFDGGYEYQKLKTVFIRMKQKWRSARYARPGYHGKSIFPIFLKETFKDVLKELQIPFAQCLFEADVEIAAIARNLKCPVLSYDSDYFVYNVLYIPFPTVHLLPYKDESTQTTDKTYYLYCKIFRVEHFLKRSGGLQKDILPFLSIMLGCDYIGNRVYKLFVSHLKQKTNSRLNKRHKRISRLLEWLSTETLESAKTKVLSCLKKHKRRGLIKQINKIISYYTDGSSELLSVLGIEVPCYQSEFANEAKNVLQLLKAQEDSNTTGDEDKYSDESDASDNEAAENDVNTDKGEDSEQDDENELSDSCSSNKNETSSESGGGSEVYDEEIEESNFECGGKQSKEMKKTSCLPECFLKYFKHGLFPSSFMDMIIHKLYFVPVQVEDYDYPSSHIVSAPIIGVIYGLIVGNTIDRFLKCIVRSFHKNRKFLDVQPVLMNASIKFPPLNDLYDLPMSKRFLILMETAGLNSDDQKCVLSLPLPWQLYITALVFWVKQTEQPEIKDSHIDSLLLCLILLNVAGKSVGCLGSTKLRRNKRKKNLLKIKSSVDKSLITLGMISNYKTEISGGSINSCTQNDNLGVKETWSNLDPESTQKEKESAVKDLNTNLDVVETLQIVSLEECGFMKKILHPYCLMDEKLKVRPELFCVSTVHSFAQFQSCLLHLTYLNALLGFPVSHCVCYQVFSGTFVYNMYNNLIRRTNSLHYICQLLSSAPSVVALFKVLRETVNKLIPKVFLPNNVKNKRCKKKQNHKVQEKIETVKDDNNDSVQSVDSDFVDPCNRFSVLNLNH